MARVGVEGGEKNSTQLDKIKTAELVERQGYPLPLTAHCPIGGRSVTKGVGRGCTLIGRALAFSA